MKELISVPIASLGVEVPTNSSFKVDERSFELIAPFVIIGFLLLFIHAILKQYLDSRIKSKIIEKNTHENVVSLLLRTSQSEKKDANLKWFIMFFGLGIALTIINYTLPLGYHSLAIMAFCIALSFLAYHLISSKRAD